MEDFADGLLDMVKGIQQVGISASTQARQALARDILALIQDSTTRHEEDRVILEHIRKRCGDVLHG